MVSSSVSAHNVTGPVTSQSGVAGLFLARWQWTRAFCLTSGATASRFSAFGQQGPSKSADPMPRYFFDTMDSGRLICDESGVELPSIQAARAEAALSLADIARDMSPDDHREVVVEVSDGEGCPLFRAALYFEIEDLVPSTL
jgi:aspartate oxidase